MSIKGSAEEKLSNFGVLGFSYDVINMQPSDPIAEFTYEKKQTFKWRDKDILIPDQITFSEAPNGTEQVLNSSSKISTAREFQTNLKLEVGLKGTDPETDMTFSGDATATNKIFKQTESSWAMQAYEADYAYAFLQLKNVNITSCLRKEVNDMASDCGLNADLIAGFYDTWGTHVVTSADVGGLMHIRTTARLNSQSSKDIYENKIDIKGQVDAENAAYIKGGLSFDQRDKDTKAIYRKVSTKTVQVVGGDVSAGNYDTWRETLRESDIPTQRNSLVSKAVHGPHFAHVSGFPAVGGKGVTQNLGLFGFKYTAICDVLNLSAEQREKFKEVLASYLKGVNPFDKEPQRLQPDIETSSPMRSGDKTKFTMRGWLATYETYVGLKATPGARAIVRCKSDAEPGGWTTKEVYAGETIKLRDKTAYLSEYMYVECVSVFDDPGAVLYAENRMVSW